LHLMHDSTTTCVIFWLRCGDPRGHHRVGTPDAKSVF